MLTAHPRGGTGERSDPLDGKSPMQRPQRTPMLRTVTAVEGDAVAVFLAYIEPVPGRVYPLVATFLELSRRGHRVTVRTGVREVETLRAAGIDASPLAPEIVDFQPVDWRARTRFGALMTALRVFGERAPFQVGDLDRAIAAEKPDVVMVDETSWGAAAAAQRSGRPWAFCLASPVPFPSRDAPPFGLGLAPRRDGLGRLRDRVVGPLVQGALVRTIARHTNPLRREMGLAAVRSMRDIYLAAPLVLVYTAEPFEYPRSDWPPNVRLVGPGLWEPPADPPDWLDELTRPLVVVTLSTAFQNDRRLAEVACTALAGLPFDVVVTTAGVEPGGLQAPPNVRVERFVPHTPLLQRAACLVCHAGMGVTQRALAHGVPVVAIPFGRDQPEVARRVVVAGAGVRLPARKLTPERLLAAVERALECRAGAERLAATFAAAGGASAAADALEALIA
jgi:MGT family glycosyltransferase